MTTWNGMATGVGSFPFPDAAQAIDFIRKCLPDIPHWPQLPVVSSCENMYLQYAEGLPCTEVNEAEGKIIFNTKDDIFGPMEKFYQNFLDHNLDAFAIAPRYAAGLYALLDTIKEPLPILKGQSLGPISFGLTVTDQDRRAIFYHDQLRDVIIKHLALKAEWQAKKLKEYAKEVIIFIDEPYLASFGSAYISLSREDVVQALNEVSAAIRNAGAIPGVHCCANTDWSLLMETDINILNFDAYEFADNMGLYPEKINEFLSAGGALAWGVIPTSEKIDSETSDSLLQRLNNEVDKLAEKGVPRDLLKQQALVTPSCGTGSLSLEQAKRVYSLLGEVGALFQSS